MTFDPDYPRVPLSRIIVLVPTYNERDSLPLVVQRLRAAEPDLDVLVIDDDSPDGTGAVADELAAGDPQIQVLHRSAKEGLGKAYLSGFQWAIDRGYQAVVEMDADGSHQPEQVGRLVAGAVHADLVIGSRWIPGGSVSNWPSRRKALSVTANTYSRGLLGIGVHDSTAGFRLYRVAALQAMDLSEVASAGYCFQIDLTLRALDRGLTVIEVPIDFVERDHGESKMSSAIVREALLKVTVWGGERRWAQMRSLGSRLSPRRKSERWHHLQT